MSDHQATSLFYRERPYSYPYTYAEEMSTTARQRELEGQQRQRKEQEQQEDSDDGDGEYHYGDHYEDYQPDSSARGGRSGGGRSGGGGGRGGGGGGIRGVRRSRGDGSRYQTGFRSAGPSVSRRGFGGGGGRYHPGAGSLNPHGMFMPRTSRGHGYGYGYNNYYGPWVNPRYNYSRRHYSGSPLWWGGLLGPLYTGGYLAPWTFGYYDLADSGAAVNSNNTYTFYNAKNESESRPLPPRPILQGEETEYMDLSASSNPSADIQAKLESLNSGVDTDKMQWISHFDDDNKKVKFILVKNPNYFV